MSNKYWGWGLEDDEFFVRLRDANLNITRPQNIHTNKTNTFKYQRCIFFKYHFNHGSFFRHIHDKNRRKRDTSKCFDQREVTRRRDRETGLHNVGYTIQSIKSLTIDHVPVTIVNIELLCDRNVTPWCDCTTNSPKRP